MTDIIFENEQTVKHLIENGLLEQNASLEKIQELSQVDVKVIVMELIDVCNSTVGKDPFVKGMVDGINSQHRYLQGEFWNLMTKVIDQYSKQNDNHFDGRNEWARDMCKRISFAVNNPQKIETLMGQV